MTSSTSARKGGSLAGIAVAASVAATAMLPALAGSATAATAPAAPTVVAPSGSTGVLKEVVLDWQTVPGAKGYRVQVGTDDEWSDSPTYTADTLGTRLTLPAWLPHGSYVWRVATLGETGQSRWSQGAEFERGWRTAPDGLTTSFSSWLPTFSWNPVATASEYQLQVSTSPYFDDKRPTATQASPVTEACFTTRTTVTPFGGQDAGNTTAGTCEFSLLGTGDTRYWRVRALDHVADDAKEVDTTPVVDEGISHAPPAKPGELDTTACPAPPVANDATAPPAAGTGGVASAFPSPSVSPTAAPPILSCEPQNTVEKGAWSAALPFSSTYVVPAADDTRRYASLPAVTPKPVTDEVLCNASAVCRDFPTLRWDAVTGADYYRVYVALDAAYSNIQEIAETPGTSWTPTAQWRESTAGKSYYYAIQPCTTVGTTPGCGPVPETPASFRKSSPKLATTGFTKPVGAEVVLSWQSHADALRAAGVPAASEAYAYHVQVTTADDPDFVGELVDEATVDATHHVAADKTYPDGTLLWRVQAVDASGHRLPWSAPRSFVHDATAPTFSVSPTNKLAVGGSVKVAFNEAVTGLSGSTVTMAGAPVIVTVGTDGRSAVLRSATPLMPGKSYPVAVGSGIADLAGNLAAPATVAVAVDPMADDRSPVMGLGGAWQRLVASNAVNGTYSRSVPTAAKPTAATVALNGRGAEVKGCVGPGNGVIELWADGVRLTRIDTYRSYSGCGVVLTRAPFKSGAGDHRIQVRGVGAKNAASKGTAIAIDAITAVK
ncbi:MAG: hypothetical protein JWP11_1126 [Frankiales bacterium]|nr:hypothetical protein [Frankiales bacterium]